mmetsp:Transcript_4046/g.2364  ORF Transcript_4046/g.2364 Transcript_4046/m.2364 type:complete len:81 (+) Transcript_4046:139-381(+)
MNIVTSVGYGDMFPTTDLERIMTMLIILTGDALFAVAFGMLASIAMSSSKDILDQYLESLRKFQALVPDTSVSNSLRIKI